MLIRKAALTATAAAACTNYTLLETRGSLELQGPSVGFKAVNSAVRKQVRGGQEYDTVYPASLTLDYQSGTDDIVNQVKIELASNPNQCFILEGYSQGAMATVAALPLLDNYYNSIKAIFLIGDPFHKPGLTCNKDNRGGTTTINTKGSRYNSTSPFVPTNWVEKTLDVCISGDNDCDQYLNADVRTPQHFEYIVDSNTHKLATTYIVKALQ